MVILDTNIIIEHLRFFGGAEDRASALNKVAKRVAREGLAISTITLQELYEGKSSKEKRAEEYLLSTIAPLKILSYTYEIAQMAGEISRDADGSVEFADAAIAATAIINGAVLYTLNKKHFQGIKQLDFWKGDN